MPDRTAVALGDRRLTFGALDARANQVARALEALGIGRGTALALWSGTTLEAIPLFAAVAKVGAVFVPVNGLLGGPEAGEIFAVCRPDLVVTETDHPLPPGAAAGDHPRRPRRARPTSSRPNPFVAEGLTEHDPHVVFFTSGSTGRPKGAILSHRTNCLRSHPGALPEPRGAMVCPYPLFHMGAWTIALQQWQARDAVVLLESADADEIGEAVRRHRATRLNCIPAVWQRITRPPPARGGVGPGHPPVRRHRHLGHASRAPRCHRGRWSPRPSSGCSTGPPRPVVSPASSTGDIRRKPGSCGVPGPRGLGPSGPRAASSGSEPVLFDGYLDDPDATAACLVDGWYRTGDVADQDDDGYLRIVGRTGDLLRTGGEAVMPSEVEAVLAEHPSVDQVAVVGLPDATWGEVVCAVVVVGARAGGPGPARAAGALCAALAPFKHPRELRLVDDLPRTASTGQVQRRLLVERLAAG